MRMKRTLLSLVVILALGAAAGAAQNPPGRTIRLKVTAEQANLREKPDIGSSIVQQIPANTVLEADRKEGEWYFVRYTLEDGGVIGGWIHGSLVTVLAEAPPAGGAAGRPAERAPARERPSRPARRVRIKPPEFRTGTIPLEFSVSAGIATLDPHDLNEGTRGYASWLAASNGLTSVDKPDLLDLAGVVGFELSYRFSPQLSFGLGADFLRGSNKGRIELAGALPAESFSTDPSVRAVPVKAVVRYYPGAGLYVRGALGVYAVKARYFFRREDAEGWEQWKGSASTTGLGAEAAFGGEWDVAPRTILFVEAGLRVASFHRLTGRNVFSNSAGDEETEAGTLFFFHKTAGGETAYPLIFVRAALPAEEGVVDARQARINISGTSLRVGLRYRF